MTITLRSDPITFALGVGQSKKLNLTSQDYYDLYIKLESIHNNSANLTIQSIRDPIISEIIKSDSGKNESVAPETKDDSSKRLITMIIIIALILIVLVAVVVHLIDINSSDKSKNKK